MSRYITIKASDLPPSHEPPSAEWSQVQGHWQRNGVYVCSRPNSGYMSVKGGVLRRSSAPAICGLPADVRMKRSGRYYCAYHTPARGDREVVTDRLSKKGPKA